MSSQVLESSFLSVGSAGEKSAQKGQMHLLSIGEGERTLVWLHANGLNARTCCALLQALAARLPGWRLLAPDLTGHGRTSLPADPTRMRDWQSLVDDFLPLLDRVQGPLVLAGHSLGGIMTLATAEALGYCGRGNGSAAGDKELLGLCLVEPVLLSPWRSRRMRLKWMFGGSFPLAKGARRRRFFFADADEALAHYRNRGMFAEIEPEALAGYLQDGLKPRQGGGVELSCAPAWEAAVFDCHLTRAWSLIPRLRVPLALLLADSALSTCPPASRQIVRRRVPSAEIQTFADTNHFLPLQRSEQVADAMVRQIQRFASDPG